MSQLPKEYSPNLPRVSSIVEFAYPFKGEDKERFLSWLWKKNIEYADYMEEASSWGRYVHNALEQYVKTWKFTGRKYKWYVLNGISFLKTGEYEVVETELYVRGKDYQWTIDIIVKRVSDGKYWILDYKTYGLAKDKFGIEKVYRKPYDKLKKASLQLSLYSRIVKKYNIEFLGIVEIWEDYCHLHQLEFWEEEDILKLIKEYELSYIDNI